MTTETAAEIGRKRLVDSSELKKKNIYTYIKNTSAPSPHEWVWAAPSCRGQGRGLGGGAYFLRLLPSSPHIPCLQFQRRGPVGKPLWEGRGLPRASTLPWVGLQVWRASPDSLGPPTPLPGPLSMTEPQVQKRRGPGRSSGGSV